MINRKIIKYAVAFARNSEFGSALGYGEGSGIGYQIELSFDYRDSAAKRAGINCPIIAEIINEKSIEKIIKERQKRRTKRGIEDLTPTQQKRAERIKEANRKWLQGKNKLNIS